MKIDVNWSLQQVFLRGDVSQAGVLLAHRQGSIWGSSAHVEQHQPLCSPSAMAFPGTCTHLTTFTSSPQLKIKVDVCHFKLPLKAGSVATQGQAWWLCHIHVVSEAFLSPSLCLQSTASLATPKSFCSTTRCRTTARGSPSSLFLECSSQLPQVLWALSSPFPPQAHLQMSRSQGGFCSPFRWALSQSRLTQPIQNVQPFLQSLKFFTVPSGLLECALLSLCGQKLFLESVGRSDGITPSLPRIRHWSWPVLPGHRIPTLFSSVNHDLSCSISLVIRLCWTGGKGTGGLFLQPLSLVGAITQDADSLHCLLSRAHVH